MTFAQIKAKLDAYERLIRLDKPVGFLLLMWPTGWGLWMAGHGAPDIRFVFIFMLGTVLMLALPGAPAPDRLVARSATR